MRYTNAPLNCFRTGDISILQVDAVVNPTNETMDDNSPMCQRIFSRAGSALRIEIFNEIKGRYLMKLKVGVCSEIKDPRRDMWVFDSGTGIFS